MSTEAGLMRGRILVFAAGIFWSTGGLFVRLVEDADSWQIVFYRSLFVAPFLIAFMAVRGGGVARKFRDAGGKAVLAGAFLGSAFTCFVLALQTTSVANVLFTLSAIPFLAAIGGLVFLGERVRPATWIAMAVGGAGLSVMVAGQMDGGLMGSILGFGAALGFTAYTILIRSGQARDMMPAVCWAGVSAALFSGGVLGVTGMGYEIGGRDLLICVAMAVVQIGFGLIAYTAGSRVVPAAELGLISLSEVVFGPIWVWLAVGEVPASATLVGGGILLLSIVGNTLTGMRRKRPPPMV